jgi:cell division septation protein DedD
VAKPAAPPPPPAKAPAKKEEAKPVAPAKAPPAKMEAKAPTKGAPVGPAKYSLQVGAMVMQQNADALKQKLDASGFPATVRKGTAPVKRQTVTVGEPTSKPEAEELARRLNVDGFPSQLVAVGSKYTPQIGAFFNLDEAIDLARELQKKNYPPKITSKPAKTTVFQVRHGRFDSRAAAVKRGEDLKSKGFNSMVVQD